MLVRLGYVSISKTIENEYSFHTVNLTNYLKQENKDEKINEVILKNLETLENTIDYNIKNNIHFYRITSSLIPLATVDDIKNDYINKYKKEFMQIGKKINNANMRVDMHPSEYTVLNSIKQEVLINTFKILYYHKNILDLLNIEKPLLILHVGSNAFGKDNSLKRFINNFNKLSDDVKKIIAIENDDKIFNEKDVIYLSRKLDIPVVLDYHHYLINHEMDLDDVLEMVKETWKNNIPKFHFSSPKSKLKKEIRTHNDYINVDSFINFLEVLKHHFDKIDIMLEAKMKDEALFKLIRNIKYKTNYKFIDDTTFLVE